MTGKRELLMSLESRYIKVMRALERRRTALANELSSMDSPATLKAWHEEHDRVLRAIETAVP